MPFAVKPSIGRIPVVERGPLVDGGRWPAKAVVGEAIPAEATVFRDGHDAFGATAVLVKPNGKEHSRVTMVDIAPGNDRYQGWLVPDAEGLWHIRVEGWSDPYATWRHNAEIKVPAGIDVELVLEEGARVLDQAASRHRLLVEDVMTLRDGATGLRDTRRPPEARLAAGLSMQVQSALTREPLREMVTPSEPMPVLVQRERALYGSWYEMFPRSEGAWFDEKQGRWHSGTLLTAAQRLPSLAEMGFDFVYLTPVHPIGTTNRKGRNNTLEAVDGDPGSPYAIGSTDGGHDAIDPSLGTFEDFDNFVDTARDCNMEVALDLALQCSPDHPWLTEHPEWFTTRVDGSIAYAENPPKKYQDIYPLNFDNDPEGIYQEIKRILTVWISHGVTAFRVDNPHTKPLPFWERLIGEINHDHPEVIFLAEAFTAPAMMRTLGAIGFQQSYTYFTWRNTKEELETYLNEVSNVTAATMRPSFWPTTHDILTPQMQQGGAAQFAIRAVLAATGSPTWGIYSGYELVENVARPGAEEHIDNEKYEFKPRDWEAAEPLGITQLITQLNHIRRFHPALQRLRGTRVHPTSSDGLMCFSRHVPAEHSPTGVADTIIVVVNLNPFEAKDGMVYLDVASLGFGPQDIPGDDAPFFAVHDELSGATFGWGKANYVRLDPNEGRSAHVLHVRTL